MLLEVGQMSDVVLAQVDEMKNGPGRHEGKAAQQAKLVLGKSLATQRPFRLQRFQNPLHEGQLLLLLRAVGLGNRGLQALGALAGDIQVRENEGRLHGGNVAAGVQLALAVHEVVVLKSPHHMQQGIGIAQISQGQAGV
ncbi:MAG: hypothetical protein GWN54_06465, partial [Gammaproteobacteria bacterium]|nr:hypothetical protein [Gammaproteobacteria bacterium]